MKQVIRRLGRLACFMWLCFGMPAGALAAEDIGMVMNMEGTMTAKGADGALRELKIFSKVLQGDTLFTGKDSYARVKFSDGGQISLRPTAQFRIDGYHYDAQQPEKDSAGFSLLKGGLRAISGLIGKRGDPDSYGVKTHTATVGIRGTKFGVLFCQRDCADIPTPDGKTPDDGMHLDVIEGTIVVKNAGGSQLLNAGQYGYVKEATASPVIVPMERAVRVDIPAKIFLDRVRGGSGEKKRDEGKPDSKGGDSAATKAAKPDGAKAKAEGDKTEGDETEGDKTEGDKTEGDKTEGDKTEGDKTEGDKTEGDKSSASEAGTSDSGASAPGASDPGTTVCPI